MKKAFGFIFVILGSLLGLISITSVPLIIETVSNAASDTSKNLAYAIGLLFYYLIHVWVSYLLFKYGFLWAVNSSFKSNPIPDEDLVAKNSGDNQ
jgi:hypothetical protein